MLTPVKENLKFEVLSWTPSTKGAATGPAVQVAPPQGPPAAQNPDAAGRGFPGGRGNAAVPGTHQG